MNAYTILMFVAVLFFGGAANAQLVQNDIGTHSLILKGSSSKITKDYSTAQGKYLYSKEFFRGAVQMRPGNIIRLNKMKVNFYTNQIHYPEADAEMAVGVENMRKIVLFKNYPADTATLEATFIILPDPNDEKKQVLFQVLNEGKTQLLKYTKVGTSQLRVDPIVGTGEQTYFYSAESYFIKTPTDVIPLKTLGKTTILGALPEASSANDWLSANKNRLKKEDDVIAFLDYWNKKGN